MIRQRVTVGTSARRRLEERVTLLAPSAGGLLARVVFRADPRSRLRRAAVRHAVRIGFEAVNRGDFEAAFAFYDPDIEVTEPPQVVKLGLDPVSRGRAGRAEVQRRWHAEWGELQIEPDEVLDLGDRLLVLGRMKGTGLASGVAFDDPIANLLTLRDGRVVRDEIFLDHGEALAAAGLPS